jgi:hypothetical protein
MRLEPSISSQSQAIAPDCGLPLEAAAGRTAGQISVALALTVSRPRREATLTLIRAGHTRSPGWPPA